MLDRLFNDPERELFFEENVDVDGLRDDGRVRLVDSLPVLCTIEVLLGWSALKFWNDNRELILESLSKLLGAVKKEELSETRLIICG